MEAPSLGEMADRGRCLSGLRENGAWMPRFLRRLHMADKRTIPIKIRIYSFQAFDDCTVRFKFRIVDGPNNLIDRTVTMTLSRIEARALATNINNVLDNKLGSKSK